MLDLEPIKARWGDKNWHFQEQLNGLFAGVIESSDVHIATIHPRPEQCAMLRLAAHAPADIAALIAEVERLNHLIEDIHNAYEQSAAYRIGSALIRAKQH